MKELWFVVGFIRSNIVTNKAQEVFFSSFFFYKKHVIINKYISSARMATPIGTYVIENRGIS